MAIWKTKMDLEAINSWGHHCMIGYLGIVFCDVGDDYLSARMPVDHRTHQPYGILHGGASCVLAETIGSTAGLLCLDVAKEYCLGINIETHHIKMAQSGYVTGTAKPVHLGRTTQLWEITIVDEQQKLISTTRLTLIVRSREHDKVTFKLP